MICRARDLVLAHSGTILTRRFLTHAVTVSSAYIEARDGFL
jgi:hypothetical protein